MAYKEDARSIAIVGVTGSVGKELLEVIHDRDYPYRNIKMIASKASAGSILTFEEKEYEVEELTEQCFDDVDIALFCTDASISKEFAPVAVDKGCIVIDNSSAFRMDEKIPNAMSNVRLSSPRRGAIISIPNRLNIICLMVTTPLHRGAKVERIVECTYQVAIGAGAAAKKELEQQIRDVIDAKLCVSKFLPKQLTYNVFPHYSEVYSNGFNKKEMKMVNETLKLWNHKLKLAHSTPNYGIWHDIFHSNFWET